MIALGGRQLAELDDLREEVEEEIADGAYLRLSGARGGKIRVTICGQRPNPTHEYRRARLLGELEATS